jgi:hypothetical protein
MVLGGSVEELQSKAQAWAWVEGISRTEFEVLELISHSATEVGI